VSDRLHAEEHLPLHPLEFRILLVLIGGPSHGYRIVQEIEAREAGRSPIYPANLYRRIRALAAAGLIEEVAPPAGAEEEDPRRRYLGVTGLGRAVARAEAERLRDLVADAGALDLLRPA
jgi:DNA-binding PadR family transcriptional regulator